LVSDVQEKTPYLTVSSRDYIVMFRKDSQTKPINTPVEAKILFLLVVKLGETGDNITQDFHSLHPVG
jgi:hypothetical protein